MLIFLPLLLLGELELLVTEAPEFGELLILLLLGLSLLLLAEDLKLSAALDGRLIVSLLLLLLLVQPVCFVLCFSDLSVQDFLLVVLQGCKFRNLLVNHLLTSLKLVLEALLLLLLLHGLEGLSLGSMLRNSLFIFHVLQKVSLLLLHHLLVGCGEIVSHLSDTLLSVHLTQLLTLDVLLDLSLDELTLEHLLLQLLDVVELEVLQLVADVLRVLHLQLVLLLKLGPHLLVILLHLFLLDLDPVLLDVPLDGGLPVFHGLLSLLLVGHITHQHLGLESLDHVLLIVHGLVGLHDGLLTQAIHVVLLLGIHASSLNLNR